MDELRQIEADARAQGEADYITYCEANGFCLECGGEGRTFNPSQTGDQAGGWADTCDTCDGSGRAAREEQGK